MKNEQLFLAILKNVRTFASDFETRNRELFEGLKDTASNVFHYFFSYAYYA